MDTKKLLAVLVSVAMCGAAFAGCGNNADSSKAESKAESSSSQVEKMPETDEEWTQAMYDKAMVSYGNTSMMQNVIKIAQSGEKVTVAYLGGSITEGISAVQRAVMLSSLMIILHRNSVREITFSM